jgi:putative endonuclease
MSRVGYVYIMTNETRFVLYTGVTSDLARRVYQHQTGEGGAFTRKYRAYYLMWYDTFPTMMQAIAAEKRIKAGSRASKIALIKEMNPEWRDLSEDFE